MQEPTADARPILVLVTWPADNDVLAFARTVVADGLAACVNVLPEMQSVYRWQGQVQQDTERQVVLKTSGDRLAALEAHVRALHPYEVPEFLVLPVEGGSDAYLAWIVESTRPAPQRP